MTRRKGSTKLYTHNTRWNHSSLILYILRVRRIIFVEYNNSFRSKYERRCILLLCKCHRIPHLSSSTPRNTCISISYHIVVFHLDKRNVSVKYAYLPVKHCARKVSWPRMVPASLPLRVPSLCRYVKDTDLRSAKIKRQLEVIIQVKENQVSQYLYYWYGLCSSINETHSTSQQGTEKVI
jgi:hypothetical protein